MSKKIILHKAEQKADFDQLVEYEKKGTLSSLIIKSSDLAIQSQTLEGIITSWNHGAEKIYGYKNTEIFGKQVSILIPPDQINELDELTKQISEGHNIPICDTKRIRKDGVVIDVQLSHLPISDNKGKIIGVVTLHRDITALIIANKELNIQNEENGRRADELIIANIELAFQDKEKEKRAGELIIANRELVFQNEEKEKRASELIIANKELVIQNKEKGMRADELISANKELDFQNEEKEKRAAELVIANLELVFQNEEKEKRAAELVIANLELVFQNEEKEKRASELIIANKELVLQYKEKEIRADELIIANKELDFQNEEKGKRADELVIANLELVFQNEEKEKRASELIIANNELVFQNEEKEKRAAELVIADLELVFQKEQKEKQVLAARELEAFNLSIKRASLYARSLIEASTDPLITISPKGKITDVNEASVKVTGVTREKLIGTDFCDYFTEPEEARVGYKMVFEKSFVADYPLTIRHKNGKLTDVLYNASVYKDENGNVLGVFAAARDVTAQKLLSNYSLSLIEASRDPLIAISPEGKITDMNEAWSIITDMSREKLTGTDFFNYFTEPQKACEGYIEVFEKGFVNDYPLTLLDGKLTAVLFNGSVYKDDRGKVLGAVLVARDITEQKRIATELGEAKVFAELATGNAEEAKIKAERATEIAENATQIAENATQIANDAVKAKQQFLSNMSHEIRTPMNAIIGFTKVLMRTDLSAKQNEYLSAIKTSGDALIVLINDILDMAKVDAGKIIFEQTPFKLSETISAMLHLFEIKIQEKNIKLFKEFDIKIPEVLLGDPVRLHQIILNLVNNAVKFTHNGKITVVVRLLSEDEEKVNIEFSVSDSGIGIPKDRIENIFENFQQASSGTSRLYGGTGLGLAIVKQLVEKQGGTISVKSKVDEGSTFSFILSFQKTNSSAVLETELLELKTEIKNIKVLVVEDIALNQLLMKTLLDDFGFEHDIAANGKIAIEMLKFSSYDIILMDLQMPEMNGFEATDYIRKTMNSKIPIIALTADVTTVDLAKCNGVGMNDYIAKPVNENLLYSKIVGLVKKTQAIKVSGTKATEKTEIKKSRCVDLDYLKHRTKSNPALMMEMISLYLEQTPPLVKLMKQSLHNKDWNSLYAAVHKMVPSFLIMGINSDYESMAKKVQQYAKNQEQTDKIPTLVLQLENICTQACIELQEEFNLIKKITHEQRK